MELVRALRPGDRVYLAHTPCAGYAVTVLRGGRLMAAAGAVTAVPLGDEIVVRHPAELIEAMTALYREVDPESQFPELPIQIEAAGQRHLVYRGTRKLGPFLVYTIHGFCPGMPGTDECVAISRSRAVPETAMSSTAQLLGGGGWHSDE